MRQVGGQKCPFLSTFRVKNVHVEAGRQSKMIKILSMQFVNDPLTNKYSRVQNKHSPTLINFLTFFQGLRPYSGLHRAYFSSISIRYKWGYAYSFCPIFQGLHLFNGLRLFQTLEYSGYIYVLCQVPYWNYSLPSNHFKDFRLHILRSSKKCPPLSSPIRKCILIFSQVDRQQQQEDPLQVRLFRIYCFVM